MIIENDVVRSVFIRNILLKKSRRKIIHKSHASILLFALLITNCYILEFLRLRTPDLCPRLFFLIRYSLSHFLQKILHDSLFFSYLKMIYIAADMRDIFTLPSPFAKVEESYFFPKIHHVWFNFC